VAAIGATATLLRESLGMTIGGSSITASFPPQQPGLMYLTEGGTETEIMYKYGFELPEFAMFPLLDQPAAVAELRGVYTRYLDTAARHGFGVVIGGLDYRASPDWADLLGYSPKALRDMQLRAIGFLREVSEPYQADLPALMYAGIVGPRGGAYSLNQTITAEEAEDYHSTQITTLALAEVDLVEAMTFNSVAESVGVARAAARAGLPVPILFTLDSNHLLHSGPSLKESSNRSMPRRVRTGPPSIASTARTPSSSSPRSNPATGFSGCDAYDRTSP